LKEKYILAFAFYTFYHLLPHLRGPKHYLNPSPMECGVTSGVYLIIKVAAAKNYFAIDLNIYPFK
tara:strand:- start:810 stop:1004 length:195 start_codon:yes stop_codon:yes gene_type:complete